MMEGSGSICISVFSAENKTKISILSVTLHILEPSFASYNSMLEPMFDHTKVRSIAEDEKIEEDCGQRVCWN